MDGATGLLTTHAIETCDTPEVTLFIANCDIDINLYRVFILCTLLRFCFCYELILNRVAKCVWLTYFKTKLIFPL